MTGATSGLGREIVLQLAARNDVHIHAIGRRGERLLDLKTLIESKPGDMSAHTLDVTDMVAVREFCAGLERLDGLILNAGITFADAFRDGNFEADKAIIDTNITSNLAIIRHVLPYLKSSNGRIFLVASLGGLVPVPYQSVYAGSKAFIVNFGLSLREELKSQNIKVSVFSPGGIATEMTDIKAMSHLNAKLAPVSVVAKQAITAYDKMKPLSVAGAENKFVAFISRWLPRHFMASQAAKIYRPKG